MGIGAKAGVDRLFLYYLLKNREKKGGKVI